MSSLTFIRRLATLLYPFLPHVLNMNSIEEVTVNIKQEDFRQLQNLWANLPQSQKRIAESDWIYQLQNRWREINAQKNYELRQEHLDKICSLIEENALIVNSRTSMMSASASIFDALLHGSRTHVSPITIYCDHPMCNYSLILPERDEERIRNTLCQNPYLPRHKIQGN